MSQVVEMELKELEETQGGVIWGVAVGLAVGGIAVGIYYWGKSDRNG